MALINKESVNAELFKINDRLCREHGLSVIEQPKEKGKHYAEWANARRGTSWKDKLRRTIDRVLPTVSSYCLLYTSRCV